MKLNIQDCVGCYFLHCLSSSMLRKDKTNKSLTKSISLTISIFRAPSSLKAHQKKKNRKKLRVLSSKKLLVTIHQKSIARHSSARRPQGKLNRKYLIVSRYIIGRGHEYSFLIWPRVKSKFPSLCSCRFSRTFLFGASHDLIAPLALPPLPLY